jgi:hypothetical protein
MSTNSKIIVNQVTASTLTHDDGLQLKVKMDDLLSKGSAVLLSFDGIISISSSFLNASIGEIISEYGFDILTNKISIVNYTPSIASTIAIYVKRLKQVHSYTNPSLC